MDVGIVLKSKKEGGRVLELIHNNLPYELMERLVGFLESQYAATVLERHDGPATRRWFVEIEGTKYTIDYFDDEGFDIFAEDGTGDALLEKLAADLKARLSTGAGDSSGTQGQSPKPTKSE